MPKSPKTAPAVVDVAAPVAARASEVSKTVKKTVAKKDVAAAPAVEVAAPAVAPVSVEPAAPAKKEKKAKASPAAAAPVVEPEVVAAPAATEEPAAPEAVKATKKGSNVSLTVLSEAVYKKHLSIVQKTKTLRSLDAEVQKEQRAFEKDYARLKKAVEKASQKKKRRVSNNAQSGFAIPTSITPELATFLGVAADTKISRTDVTKQIHAYVKANNLQFPDNRKVIVVDDKLCKVLKVPEDMIKANEFTYFKLQSFLKDHFISNKAVATA